MKHQHTTVTFETRLAYTNAFDEEMALTMSPETHQSDYDWRADRPDYKNVRWERRTVVTTTTDWEPLS